MKIKTSEAKGHVLNWLVAKCEGLTIGSATESGVYTSERRWFQPSTDWAQGGPIIEREGIELRYHDVVVAGIWYRDGIGGDECTYKAIGPAPLVAGMRCYVASKLGEEVEVPDELI